MNIAQGALMGLVQGLTEFLPISSSGHLALLRVLLNLGPAEDVSFEVLVHLGTLGAVVVFYYKRLFRIGRSLINSFVSRKKDQDNESRYGLRYLWWLFIATIPAAVVGLSIKDEVEVLFNHITWVGVAWLLMGVVLVLADRIGKSHISPEHMGWKRALGIGTAQMIAIMPGISRSGSTIVTALAVGVERRGAVEFSFLLSLPAIMGAVILTVMDWQTGGLHFTAGHWAGFITSAISGYWAIGVLLNLVAGRRLYWFGVYCLLLGTLTLLFLT